MKVVARFPIKSSPLLIITIIGFHTTLAGIVGLAIVNSILELHLGWLVIFYLGLSTSCFYCYRHYLKITYATDDLCWNGRNWLIYSDDHLNAVIYLKLKPESWVSNYAALLHFECDSNLNQKEYQWFFSRTNLGKRFYSDLIYLVKQDLKNNYN